MIFLMIAGPFIGILIFFALVFAIIGCGIYIGLQDVKDAERKNKR